MKPPRSIKNIFVLVLLMRFLTVYGQVIENFSDGDFTSNPTWSGSDARFTINTGFLKLQAPALAETAYLSTTSQAIHNATWEFYVRMDFNPSSTNFSRIYLTSNQADLTAPLNGYYIMVGNTDDEVSLYKQTGTTRTKIIDGLNGRVNLDPVLTKIKVTRDASGKWDLYSDVGSTGTYVSEGSIIDITHTASGYMGVQCTYTATRSSHFWFDDFVVTGTIVPDLNPPVPTGVQIVDENSLMIAFNEVVESVSALNANNYLVNNNIGTPINSSLQPDNKSVLISLATQLTNGLNYSIQISGVNDPDGNTMTQTALNFLYFIPQPSNKKDIIVSEFMADQTPVVGLPEAEFVELFNRSLNPINLSGWKLTDGSLIATLPNFILLPQSYCIVTSMTSANMFPGSLGVSNFPSLNNAGDNLIVKNDLGITIDSIRYATSWYNHDEKKDGGWSIEIIDPENLCGEELNWTASVNSAGGTPGSINSVDGNNPDVIAPKIFSTQVINPNTIEIIFDEKMDGAIVNAVSDPPLSFNPGNYSTSLRQTILTSASSISFSMPYSVTLSGVRDCSGNSLIDNTFQFVLPELAQPGDVIVNEILFNPRSGGVDFVEIYNNTNKYLSLKKWSVSNYDEITITNSKSLPTSSTILQPNSYKIITTDSSILKTQYPNTVNDNCIISTLPSFPDDRGSVALVDSLGIIIDYFIYNESYHTPSINQDGVSLERISFTTPSADPNNWKSAAAYENHATPGYKNSASYPFLVSFTIASSNSIFLAFNAPLEVVSAQTAMNYLLNQSIGTQMSIELQDENKGVLITYQEDFSNGLNYILTISGVKDPDGKILPAITYSFLYFIPSPVNPKDIIVSEFMADPAPVVGLPEAEFIELFNRSNQPIDMMGWKLTDGGTTATLPQYILLPSHRCVITANSAAALFPGSIGVNNFPSLNNTADNIILKTPTGKTIDSITYSPAWYHSNEKQDGGWSLEIVDPENLCGEESNWTASENFIGGTPGALNSVNANNPDVTAPLAQACVITSENSLEVFFNEKMSEQPIPSTSINPSINISSAQFDLSLRKLKLNTSDKLEKSIPYTLTLLNAYDCSGNVLESNSIQFILPDKADEGEVLLNEILFNPKSGGVDFVEVYNKTNRYLSLEKWVLSNYQDGIPQNPREIKVTNPVIPPHAFMVFTSDVEILKSHYPRAIEEALVTTTLPSLPDDEGSIALADSTGKVLDYFIYTDDYHVAFLKDKEGVSLERITLDVETNHSDNWRSASQFENFATPGYKNSASSSTAGVIDGDIVVEPEIFSPEVPPNDFTRINYRFGQSGKVANASIYDHQGRVIKVLTNNEVLGVEGFFRWDGDRDDGGRARAGYYMVLVEVFDIEGSLNIFRKRVVIAYR